MNGLNNNRSRNTRGRDVTAGIWILELQPIESSRCKGPSCKHVRKPTVVREVFVERTPGGHDRGKLASVAFRTAGADCESGTGNPAEGIVKAARRGSVAPSGGAECLRADPRSC
jgi:hypothetical protein